MDGGSAKDKGSRMQVGHEPKQRRLKSENGKEMCHVADSNPVKTEFIIVMAYA